MKIAGKSLDAPLLSVSHKGKEDVTRLLIQRFQLMLRDDEIQQGSRLPPERELAAHFKVARSSLRQALKVLEIMGVITQRVGDGSYLNTDTSTVLLVPMEFLCLLEDTSVQEVIELRLLIEPGRARLAAERATPDDIALLHQSIREFEASAHDTLKLVSAHLLFHHAIFKAAQNGPAASVFHSLHRAMARMILVTLQLVDPEHTLAFHKPIAEAIAHRDGDLAARLTTDHLNDARDILVREQARHRQAEVDPTATRTSL